MKGEHKLTLRLSAREKDRIKEESRQNCMSINQYIKYKVLETEPYGVAKSNAASKFLDKNFALLTRILISGYMHTRMLGCKHLSKDELERINIESIQEFQKLEVEKGQEEHLPSLEELRRTGRQTGEKDGCIN